LSRGWGRLCEFAHEHNKFRFIDPSLDFTVPYTIWSGVFGGAFMALATHGTDQLMVQRYLSARSQREAGRALALSGLVICVQFALFLLIGVALACFYDQFSPQTHFGSNDNDKVFSHFIVHHLPIGAVGIVVAAVFSASMSTLSSSLNSSAAAAVNDFYVPWSKDKPPAKRLLRVSRKLTIAFGLVQIGVAVVGQFLGETMMDSVVEGVMAIAGFTAGVILGVFFLGVLTSRVTQRAALAGLVGGLAVMTTVVVATDLTWPWFAIVGSSVTFAVGLAVHTLLPATQSNQYNPGRHDSH
jgi:Na+/proline symporter